MKLYVLYTCKAYSFAGGKRAISKRKVTGICGETDMNTGVSKKDWSLDTWSLDTYLPTAL